VELFRTTVLSKVADSIDDTKSLKQHAEDMKKLPLLEDLSDVVFVCGGKEIKAHRNILAARSPVFMAMFTHEMAEKKSGRVTITDFTPEEMRDFLHFIYNGKLDSMDNAVKLLDLADQYQVETLKEMCEIHLLGTITYETMIENLILANRHNSQYGLKQKAFELIKEFLGPSYKVPDSYVDKVEEVQYLIDNKISVDAYTKE